MANKKKEVIIIARVQWKNENKVAYLVRADKPLKDGEYTLRAHGVVEYNGATYQSVARNGERYLVYQVAFFNGHIAGCQCSAHVTCYHKRQLIAIEAARTESAPAAAGHIIETEMTVTESVDVVDAELEEILQEIELAHAIELHMIDECVPVAREFEYVNGCKIRPRTELLAAEVVLGELNGRPHFHPTGRAKISNYESHLYPVGFVR
jgi:hypothetical protein